MPSDGIAHQACHVAPTTTRAPHGVRGPETFLDGFAGVSVNPRAGYCPASALRCWPRKLLGTEAMSKQSSFWTNLWSCGTIVRSALLER
jgi:hypothetical protein